MNDRTAITFPAIAEGIIGDTLVQTVDARHLHAALGVGKVFAAWIVDRITSFGFNENSDFVVFSETGKNSTIGRPSKEYALTLDMAKELAMVERNDAGKKVRAYFIECERKLREAPPTAAIDLDDPAFLRGTLLTYTEKVIALQEEVELMRPAVDAIDRLVEAHGSLCITDAAKSVQVPPAVLFRWLRTNGWIYKRAGSRDDIAYQSRLASGCLTHKVETYQRLDGTEGARTQVRITPKGLTVLAKAFPPAVQVAKPSRRGVAATIGALVALAAGALLPAPPARAAVPVSRAALPAIVDPLRRAQDAWEAFAAAMRDATADSHGWLVMGGEQVHEIGYMAARKPWLTAKAIDLVPIPNSQGGLADRHTSVIELGTR